MANVAIILGKSGTGKSTSIKTLDSNETIVVNPLRKRLPFKGSNGMYSKDKKNISFADNADKIIKILKSVDESMKNVKNIVIDDAIYIMRKEYFDRAKETGYNKYTDLAVHFQSIIETCETLRDDLNVFLILHSEDVSSDGAIVSVKVSTVGSLLDKQYNPVEVVPMVLISDVEFDDKGVAKYGFITHKCLKKGIDIPAKSPDGMFEEDFIPNDLNYVIEKMNEYYQ